MTAWHRLYERVLPYVVRVETMRGSGTGFLFGYNAERSLAAVATAAHGVDDVLAGDQPIKLVHHVSGKEAFLTSEDYVIELEGRCDSASILFAADALPFPGRVLPLIERGKFRRVGEELGWMGYPSIVEPKLCFFSGRVSAVVEWSDSYLIDGVAISGVSGGPVFADLGRGSPQIVGTVKAYGHATEKDGATTPGLMHAQDITHFHQILMSLRSLDDARRNADEAARSRPELPGREKSESRGR